MTSVQKTCHALLDPGYWPYCIMIFSNNMKSLSQIMANSVSKSRPKLYRYSKVIYSCFHWHYCFVALCGLKISNQEVLWIHCQEVLKYYVTWFQKHLFSRVSGLVYLCIFGLLYCLDLGYLKPWSGSFSNIVSFTPPSRWPIILPDQRHYKKRRSIVCLLSFTLTSVKFGYEVKILKFPALLHYGLWSPILRLII